MMWSLKLPEARSTTLKKGRVAAETCNVPSRYRRARSLLRSWWSVGFSPHWWKRSQRADVSNVAPCSTGCWVWLCVITCRSLVISGSFVGLVLVGSYSAAMALSRLLTVNAGHCEVCVAISMKFVMATMACIGPGGKSRSLSWQNPLKWMRLLQYHCQVDCARAEFRRAQASSDQSLEILYAF